jgi:soluble P-type ATPase
MLREAVIGIAVASVEGLAIESLNSADVVVPDIIAAFELLEHPTRLVATLRR